MNLWQQHISPTSLERALQALRDFQVPTAVIAGGTDLLLDLDQGRHPPVDALVDLTSVRELGLLEIRDDMLFVGASVPISRVAGDPLVTEHARALAEACDLIGGPQVRNVATLGGNVAHALPAADGTIALVALGATAEIAALSGLRRAAVTGLFKGPGISALVPRAELISGFYVPLRKTAEGSSFRRVMRPQGVALPIINVAVWLRRAGTKIEASRIAVGPSGPVPMRSTRAESVLGGRQFSTALCREAAAALLSQTTFRSSPRRASSPYRKQLVEPLLLEALESAWERASP